MPAEMLRNRIRGFQPWPSCFTVLPGQPPKRLKVFAATVEPAAGQPGKVLDTEGAGPLVAAGEDALRLLDVQPEGKKRMTGHAFLLGANLTTGDVLG